jgi:plasmid stability protein
MTDVLIRDVDAGTLKRLKARAKRNRRSLQNELKLLLDKAAGPSVSEFLDLARRNRDELGRRFDDCTDLIREDRDR